MTLLLDNEDVRAVLTMDVTMRALEEAYAGLASGDSVCRPRIDVRIPTDDPAKTYRFGTMEGGSASGYFAIRLKSDIVFEENRGGGRGRGPIAGDRSIGLADLLSDRAKGRASPRQITFSERGNIQGAQFFAVAGKAYELAKAKGLGREIPTEWFLQDVRN